MGRFTEKQLTIMTIGVSVVITGLFAALIYMDMSKIGDQRDRIKGLKGNITVAELQAAKIPGRITDVIVNREIVKRDSAILPDETEINEFVNKIGDFEKLSGVVVQGISPISTGRGKGQKEAILKIPVKLKLRGSMDQFLKFMNFFENYDRLVSVTGFTINSGGEKDENGNIQHPITLALETYQYDPKGGSVVRVDIPDYERKKQSLAIQKAIRANKKAAIEKYQMKPRINRRDPLVDPREPAVHQTDEGVDPVKEREKQKAIVDQLALDVTLLKDDCRVEQKLKETQAFMRLAAVSRAIDQHMAQIEQRISVALSKPEITIPDLKDMFSQKVVQPFEEIKQKRKSAGPTEVIVERRYVFDTLKQMKQEFDKANYKGVIQVCEGFERYADGKKFAPDAAPLRKEMKKLVQQAQVITRFESEPLRIDGVIIDPRRTSYAIINGLILAEGDYVDGDRKIQIHEIHSDRILFAYEGVVIPKAIRKK